MLCTVNISFWFQSPNIGVQVSNRYFYKHIILLGLSWLLRFLSLLALLYFQLCRIIYSSKQSFTTFYKPWNIYFENSRRSHQEDCELRIGYIFWTNVDHDSKYTFKSCFYSGNYHTRIVSLETVQQSTLLRLRTLLVYPLFFFLLI